MTRTFLPVKVNGEYRWLERAYIKQELEHQEGGWDEVGCSWDESYTWINKKWVDEEITDILTWKTK